MMSKNSWLLIETVLVFIINALAAIFLFQCDWPDWIRWPSYAVVLLFQGLWYYRCYIVGHEASHKKLIQGNLFMNDLLGSIVLLPLMVPISIYRKIHYFHHGFNRKNHETSALDTFIVKGRFRTLKTMYYYGIWYVSVFFGGFFIHSLVSVVLFLFIPPSLSTRISPAFLNWTWKDQLKSISLFIAGVCFHGMMFWSLGKENYLLAFGWPLLSFAWVLSLMVYIFHYDTTKGEQVRFNVRSVKHVPFLSWVLMNFNEHATHHQYPNIPWYELPQKRKQLPLEFEQQNQQTRNFFMAILRQLKGPLVMYE